MRDNRSIDELRYANAARRGAPRTSKRLLVAVIVGFLMLGVCATFLVGNEEDDPAPATTTSDAAEPTSAPTPLAPDVAADEATVTAAVEATIQAKAIPAPAPPPSPTPTITMVMDCDDERFMGHVLKLLEDQILPPAPRILKVYHDAEAVERTARVLRCRGTALLSTGEELGISYHYEIDRDGDSFVGYKLGEVFLTPTPTSSSAAPTPTPPPIGTTVEAGGSAYTVNEVLDPAPTGGRGVEAGKRLVAIDITQTCIADGDSYNTFDFFVQDADGYVYDTGFGYTGVEPRIGSGELAAGQRVRGWVTIQVPASAVLVSVLVAAEGSGPKILIADLMAGQPSVASEPAPMPTIGPDTTPAELVEWVKDGVVRVTAGSSGGSGFIFATVGDTAFVVTNHHVIEDADAIDVTVKDARTYPATLLGFNSDKDVAVLAICCDSSFVVLHWESGSAPALSTPVIAIGYPRSAQTGVIATTGEIAGPDTITRRYDVIAHTAPLNPGNSGGPLLSMDGRVLGINVGSSTFEHEAVYYAVPYGTIEQQIADWKSRLVVAP